MCLLEPVHLFTFQDFSYLFACLGLFIYEGLDNPKNTEIYFRIYLHLTWSGRASYNDAADQEVGLSITSLGI